MTFAPTELVILLPEILLLTMGCIILIMDAYKPTHQGNLTYQLSQGSLIGVALLVFAGYPSQTQVVMNGMFILDPMAAVLKLFIVLLSFAVFVYSRDYLKQRDLFKGEYLVLGLFAVLGMMILVSAHNLLTLYLGLELLSLSLYSMVAMQRDSQQAVEAAMKYFILGALASGMLLYGISMLYGATGTLELTQLAQIISQHSAEQHNLLVFGLIFVLVGVAFKMGAVPFHMWIPDVYQGAPTAVTLFISTAPKLAAFAMLMRLLVDGLQALHADWQGILIILAVLSIALGNIVAIAQSNIKRLFAYSTISHIGFLMLGVITGTPGGYAAAMFYTIVYALMSLGGFGMIILLSRAGFEAENISDFKGLNQRNPWYAFIMLVLMLSMAGIPPLLGFWAKLAVFSQVVQAGLIWLAVVAVLLAIIGAFYYLRIVWVMYFDQPEDSTPLEAAIDMRVLLSANGLIILFLGIMPQALMELCAQALGVI